MNLTRTNPCVEETAEEDAMPFGTAFCFVRAFTRLEESLF